MDDEKSAADNLPAEEKGASAWQPFTPRGVAAFANASFARLMVLELVVALTAAFVVIWFINANYSPTILEAIQNLPDEAALQHGKLTNISSRVLIEKKFLSVVVDLEQSGQLGKIADFQLDLRANYFQICSLFGCAPFEYPKENILIGRSTSEPWWGARQPVILALCGSLVAIGLLLIWATLALFYALIAKLIAYFADRQLSWSSSWRLASAAQMMAALLMSLSIVLYGLQAFDLIRFVFFFGLHFVAAWIYVVAAPFSLPNVSKTGSTGANPFSSSNR
jgi:hypothetical protein